MAWDPVTHMADAGGVSGSQLWPDPALAIVGI